MSISSANKYLSVMSSCDLIQTLGYHSVDSEAQTKAFTVVHL